MNNKSLGICIGASTISFVMTKKSELKIEILSVKSMAHGGNPKKVLIDYFHNIDFTDLSVVVTGRKFKELINCFSVSEPEAIERAIKFLDLGGKYGAVASLGGENFMVYCLSDKGDISNVLTGNKCASGTGEFFLQQIRRMDLNVEEAVLSAADQEPHHLSGRCSVFCKSDCTHALNKGASKGRVVAGLCQMIANKIIELLAKQKSEKIIVIGGVSKNKSVIHFLREKYPNIYIPNEAAYFEALGASLIGLEKESKINKEKIFRSGASRFSFLEPLSDAASKVVFKNIERGEAEPGDVCLVGLDVGSTTTKAVVIRKSNNALLASAYLRTNGNPIGASIECYGELKKQINQPVKIIGLGVTGSGRHIAGLHALTKAVINEIIAHAVAAAFFDQEVDTIFEIGGQDAKYTYLTNGIASDYAMNEACSAGTGSFLEEAARESLNIDYRDIGEMALKADQPPNFNDQCAAFISSDIKNASQEGISQKNIVAGLVYSICLNYINRVKGNRPAGHKIFMQGGVCYNRAVPIAMASLVNKEIIVPPEPGLMGAYGVALEVKNRLELGLLKEVEFDFDQLINREFKPGRDFVCFGGGEDCDRQCKISLIEVEGKKYPFGGACNKYYNQRLNLTAETEANDYVKIRQDLVFKKYASLPAGSGQTMGIARSFLTNTFFPFYYNFFTKLGLRVVVSEKVEAEGVDKIRSSFCYPVEIAHGLFQDLINQQPDYIFLPHITQTGNEKESGYKRTCVFVQGEPYYIKVAFSEDKLPKIIAPIIDFSQSKEKLVRVFIALAKELGKNSAEAREAYNLADKKQGEMLMEFKELGRQAIAKLEADKNKFAVVLFGRSYNAFAKEANLGIPHKIASKNIMIIPYDFLPSDELPSYEHMYWYSGQQIIRGSRFVKSHNQLFGFFITNFSCGPDSFIISYFRKIMGVKPSLTLELDSHSADVGVDTRIDAAMDIIKNYLELKKQNKINDQTAEFKPLVVGGNKGKFVITESEGKNYNLCSPEVEVVIPSMGRFGTELLAAVFKSVGVNAKPLPVPTLKTLKYGRSHTSCKECLPFILTTGSMIEYVNEENIEGKKILFFMPHSTGPCRQGQYFIGLKDTINELKLKDVGVLSLNDENSYGGLGLKFFLKAWLAVLISDSLGDMENAIFALAKDPVAGLKILNQEWEKLLPVVSGGGLSQIFSQLNLLGEQLANIKLKQPLEKAKIISLIGEVYVRREEFSRLDLIKALAEKGFVVKVAPVAEYLYYCNYLTKKGMRGDKAGLREKIKITLQDLLQKYFEQKVKRILSRSGLIHFDYVDVEKTLTYAKTLISEKLLGEGVLTTGLALREIINESCGVISIGPFACMPSRLAESILSKEMTLAGKIKSGGGKHGHLSGKVSSLPYLHIETDGNLYPPITQSKIEIFMLQAEKLYEMINK